MNVQQLSGTATPSSGKHTSYGISNEQMEAAYHSLNVFEYIGYVEKQGYYTFFTTVELSNCLKTEKEHICTGRKAEITDLKIGSTVVHSINKEEFMLKLEKKSNAKVFCPNEEMKVISKFHSLLNFDWL